MSDKTYILGCIEQGVGVGTFNNTIRKWVGRCKASGRLLGLLRPVRYVKRAC